ncbi:hypothetical protein [Vibrio atlanticus]|uniref:hypothetical protein n=1 Tax=Vibrio atlanticus TaxID=693153 RepID=UPI00354FD7A7
MNKETESKDLDFDFELDDNLEGIDIDFEEEDIDVDIDEELIEIMELSEDGSFVDSLPDDLNINDKIMLEIDFDAQYKVDREDFEDFFMFKKYYHIYDILKKDYDIYLIRKSCSEYSEIIVTNTIEYVSILPTSVESGEFDKCILTKQNRSIDITSLSKKESKIEPKKVKRGELKKNKEQDTLFDKRKKEMEKISSKMKDTKFYEGYDKFKPVVGDFYINLSSASFVSIKRLLNERNAAEFSKIFKPLIGFRVKVRVTNGVITSFEKDFFECVACHSENSSLTPNKDCCASPFLMSKVTEITVSDLAKESICYTFNKLLYKKQSIDKFVVTSVFKMVLREGFSGESCNFKPLVEDTKLLKLLGNQKLDQDFGRDEFEEMCSVFIYNLKFLKTVDLSDNCRFDKNYDLIFSQLSGALEEISNSKTFGLSSDNIFEDRISSIRFFKEMASIVTKKMSECYDIIQIHNIKQKEKPTKNKG